jgi:uncharacterized membrane protein
MGGLLIVRYGVEAGVFGPVFRVTLGAVFALAMAGLSEFLRRKELRFVLPGVEALETPAIVAGVAALSAFGVVYAAHGLYGFIGERAAFAGFAAIGVATLAASLLHGPALGVFGLAGSYATPLLVNTSDPAPYPLALFVAAVAVVSWALQARRPSFSMQAGTIVGHSLWTAYLAHLGAGDAAGFLSLAAIVCAAGAIEAWSRWGVVSRGVTTVAVHTARGLDFIALAAPIVLAGVVWTLGDPAAAPTMSLMLIASLAVAAVAAAALPNLAALAILIGVTAVGVVLFAPPPGGMPELTPEMARRIARLDLALGAPPNFAWFAVCVVAATATPWLLALLQGWRNAALSDSLSRAQLALPGALVPVGTLLAVSLRQNGLERSTPFALMALALMAALAGASELLYRNERKSAVTGSTFGLIGAGAYGAAAAIALGLAVAFGLRDTWLAVGFAVASAGVAFVQRVRPAPLLRTMAAMLAAAALGRVVFNPVLSDLGQTPLLNWLVAAYALPAAALAAGAAALAPRRDKPRGALEGAAAAMGGAFVLLEIVHAFVGGDLFAVRLLFPPFMPPFLPPPASVGGWSVAANQSFSSLMACLAFAAGALALGYARLAARFASPTLASADAIARALATLTAILGLCVLANPALTGMPMPGRPVFNMTLLNFGGLALGFAALALASEALAAPRGLAGHLQALALSVGAVGALLIVQHAFAGENLGAPIGAAQAYYAAVAQSLTLVALAAATLAWMRAQPGRTLSIGLHVFVAAAIAWATLRLGLVLNPFFDGPPVEGMIVFNRILWGYGPLAAGFLGLAALTRRSALAPVASLALALAGAAFCALTLFLLTRHALHGATLRSDLPVTLAEAGIYGLAAMAAALAADKGLERAPFARDLTAAGWTAGVGAQPLAQFFYWGMIGLAVGHVAPVVGWPIVNNTLVAFLAPAAAAAMLALRAEQAGEVRLSRICGGSAIVAGLGYVLMQVRVMFPELDWAAGWASSEHRVRLFAYSFALIGYGLALLLIGLRTRRRDLRIAAIAILLAATMKAFLLDLSGLEGLWRAASFIGLGFSLMGIAYLYRLLLPTAQERSA